MTYEIIEALSNLGFTVIVNHPQSTAIISNPITDLAYLDFVKDHHFNDHPRWSIEIEQIKSALRS